MSEVFKPLINVIEFTGVLLAALLVQNAIYKLLIHVGAGVVFSAIGSHVVFGLIILAYYQKIRAYIQAKFNRWTFIMKY